MVGNLGAWSGSGRKAWVVGDSLPSGPWWRAPTVVVGASFVSLGAQVATPSGSEVPGTRQLLAVLLVEALVGPVIGTMGVALYVLLGILGAPVFANGTSGYGGPASGYFIGLIIAALIVGLVSRRASSRAPSQALPSLLAAMAVGVAATHVCGLALLVMRVSLSLTEALSAGFTPFIVVDALEAVVAAAAVGLLASALRPRTER